MSAPTDTKTDTKTAPVTPPPQTRKLMVEKTTPLANRVASVTAAASPSMVYMSQDTTGGNGYVTIKDRTNAANAIKQLSGVSADAVSLIDELLRVLAVTEIRADTAEKKLADIRAAQLQIKAAESVIAKALEAPTATINPPTSK